MFGAEYGNIRSENCEEEQSDRELILPTVKTRNTQRLPLMSKHMLTKIKRIAKALPYIRDVVRERDELRLRDRQLQLQIDALTVQLRTKDIEGEQSTFSTWGEDRILAFLFSNRPIGFYVDVGCYHPTLHSNTKLLYEKGWRGINIDCNAFMIDLCSKNRPEDINLNIAVADNPGKIKFFSFGDWASSNTILPSFKEHISLQQNVPVHCEKEVEACRLEHILNEHLPGGKSLDFLNVDVEQADLSVLRSNDWGRYRPLVIAIEDIYFDFQAPNQSDIYRYLKDLGYTLISRVIYTNIFGDRTRAGMIYGFP